MSVLASIDRALEEFGPGPCDIIGFSYGGWIAQCFASRFPERVRRLVLAHSFVLESRYAGRFRLAVKAWRLIPDRWLAKLVMKRAALALAPLRVRDPAKWADVRRQLEAQLRYPGFLESLLAQQYCLLESLLPPFRQIAEPFDKPMLIIESDDDPIVRDAERRALRQFYPSAAFRTFERAGHVSALTEPAALASIVQHFLDAS